MLNPLDLYDVRGLITEDERMVQDSVGRFVDERVLPVAVQNDIDHRLDFELIEGMAELGILGVCIPEEYGGAGFDYISLGLVCEELEAVDTFLARQAPQLCAALVRRVGMRKCNVTEPFRADVLPP